MHFGTRALMAAALLAGAVSVGAPSEAHAVELYWDAHGRVVGARGRPVRYVVPNPRRYYVGGVPPLRVVQAAPAPTRVRVHVEHRSSPPPADTAVDRGRDDDRRQDPYEIGGIVVAGAGMGGVLFLGDGVTGVAVGYKLHLGLAVGAAEFGLRFDLVPDAMDISREDGGTAPAALYTAGATFNYRFLDRATVHPVFGVGLESILLDPHQGATGTAFAVTGRAGLELAYPLSDGALALGIDLTGHHPFGATDAYAADVVDMLTFGAYGDYRF